MSRRGVGWGRTLGGPCFLQALLLLPSSPYYPWLMLTQQRWMRTLGVSPGSASCRGDIALSRTGSRTLGSNFPTKPIPGLYLILWIFKCEWVIAHKVVLSRPFKPVHSSGMTLARILPLGQWDAVPLSLMGNHPCNVTMRYVIKMMG